jgi:hypothetical protein
MPDNPQHKGRAAPSSTAQQKSEMDALLDGFGKVMSLPKWSPDL